MTPEQWRRVEAVFNEVVELPADERPPRIAIACAHDDELRREVESLLASVPEAARAMRETIGRVAATLPRAQLLRTGERLGDRYLIEELLGEGGMGAVYRAIDEKLGEPVALKVVRRAVDDQLLRDEVRLAQRVTHPNVCRTFDLEEVDGHQLVKMELVRGETLAVRLLRDGRLPIAECVRIARGLAAGLRAAHDRQIVHGDLKPANIMLDGDRVVLMDFGIARIAAAPLASVRGTVGYLAPELVRDRQADQRADLYALGCVLYEMLTGEPVFPASSTTQVGARHVAMPVPDVRRVRADTPHWLSRALADLLAKRPEERDRGLARVVAGPRSRARIAVPVAVVVAAAIAITWWLTRPAPWVAQVRDYAGFDENVDSMTFSPDGDWLIFSSDRLAPDKPRLYVMSVRTGKTTPLLPDQDARSAVWSDGAVVFSDDHDHVLRQRVEGSPPRPVGKLEVVDAAAVPQPCGSDALRQGLLLGGAPVSLRLRNGETRRIFTSAPGDLVMSAMCDPSGEHIAIVAGDSFMGGHNDVFMADRAGHVQPLTTDHRTGDSALFTPDGRSLVVSRLVDGRLQLFEMSLDGKQLRRLLDDGGPDEPLEISHDGRSLAFSRGEDTFLPAIVSAGGTSYVTRERDTYTFPREVRPGLFVAATVGRAGHQVALVQKASVTSVLARGRAPFASLDGATIYFSGADDVDVLYAMPTAGGVPREVARLPGPVFFGNAAADGLHVLVQVDATHFAGFCVHGATFEREAEGLVTVPPSGGWRAVTVIDGRFLFAGAELYILAPGATLDHPWRHVHVLSVVNPWLDDHRIGYVLADHAEVLDVATGATTTLSIGALEPAFASLMRDGEHVLGCVRDPRYTRHVMTNFGDR